ncbi:Flagellar motor switch protein FliM [Candidatus Arcanobacter lacustris]|uniref:Flagellar motor switch protein FliM n=1 Tax=Candidatus Arcanibacter lacustris TaxID=1607817 RepID=A0A0F5MR55_9RICK|nr:Flagellar motor switch protein FliM [Candidatus Arcanobacter lacustris]
MTENDENTGQGDASDSWEQMLAQEEAAKTSTPAASEAPEADAPTSVRSLNQEEIDSLLGFSSDNKDDDSKNRGIRAMLDKALQSYERLPMLEVVFDRFVRILSTSIRNFTSETVDIDIKSISSLRFGNYINSIPMPSLLTVFKAVEWENFGLISADGSLIYSLVDVLFGGRKVYRPIRFEGRPYTVIEQGIVRQLSDIILADLASAFDPLSTTTLVFERIETNPRFATISRPADAAILLQLRVEMEERAGKIDILFPYATLEPIRALLLQVFIGEKFGKDAEWEGNLQNEIFKLDIDLEAVLKTKVVLMQDVVNLKVGSTIIMDDFVDDDIILNCCGNNMFAGKIGKVGEKIAVSITDVLNKKLIHSEDKEK